MLLHWQRVGLALLITLIAITSISLGVTYFGVISKLTLRLVATLSVSIWSTLLVFTSWTLVWALFPLPYWMINVSSGYLLGFGSAIYVSLVSLSIGVLVGLGIFRKFMKDKIVRWILSSDNITAKELCHLLNSEGALSVAAIRNFPLVSLAVGNYLIAASTIPFPLAFMVSVLALVPDIVIGASIGASLQGVISQLESTSSINFTQFTLYWIYIGLSIAVAVVFGIYCTFKVKRMLAKRSDLELELASEVYPAE